MKFEAYADLAGMGAHLDVAAEQTALIKHEALDANGLLVSRKGHALVITRCEGKALSLVSLVPRRFGLEAWRVLKDVYEGIGGNRMAALPRGILNPCARWERCTVRDVTLATCLHPEGRCTVQNCRRCRPPASGSGGNRDGTRASSSP